MSKETAPPPEVGYSLRPQGKKKFICANCGHIGSPTAHEGGCFIAPLLWGVGLVCVFAFGLFVGGFVCLGALAYTIYALIPKSSRCPKCSTPNMVPEDTPRGQELLAKYGKNQQ